jgi:predicted cupin superfamily sugar epimerase
MTQLDDILNCYDWFDHIDGPKFVETHRDQFRTSGHWLFLPKVISYFHKVDNNAELWYIHIGRLVIHLLTPEGLHQELYLGTDIHSGERPVVVIPANCWQAAEIPEGVPFAFGTNVCAPPFSYESLTIADQESLIREYPLHSDLIKRFTRNKIPK